ncbi:MAG: hypothetical protein V1850_00300 [Candidatus Bathyarchaeota archaeon]
MIAVKREVLRALMDKHYEELKECASVEELNCKLAKLAKREGYRVVDKS